MDEPHETPENNASHATGKKSTNDEIDGRVEEIYTRLLQCQPRKEIVAYYTREWGVSVKTIDNYIARARKLIARDARLKKEDELDLARANLDFLYRQLCKIQDFKGALSVVKARAELLGLNAPAKTEISGADGAPLQIAIAPLDYRQILTPLAPDDSDASDE